MRLVDKKYWVSFAQNVKDVAWNDGLVIEIRRKKKYYIYVVLAKDDFFGLCVMRF